jgi:hypothetical protein
MSHNARPTRLRLAPRCGSAMLAGSSAVRVPPSRRYGRGLRRTGPVVRRQPRPSPGPLSWHGVDAVIARPAKGRRLLDPGRW